MNSSRFSEILVVERDLPQRRRQVSCSFKEPSDVLDKSQNALILIAFPGELDYALMVGYRN